jgi:ketosteroid isomerase-like protein
MKAKHAVARTREQAEELAWRPWERIGAGDVDKGLALLDDGGTWWEMATRNEQPMDRTKAVLVEVFSLFPMRFALVGSIVEDTRVALMVESFADLPDGGRYKNAYTFITTLHPVDDQIIHVREYVDTLRASQTLVPAVLAVAAQGQGSSVMGDLLDGVGTSSDDVHG